MICVYYHFFRFPLYSLMVFCKKKIHPTFWDKTFELAGGVFCFFWIFYQPNAFYAFSTTLPAFSVFLQFFDSCTLFSFFALSTPYLLFLPFLLFLIFLFFCFFAFPTPICFFCYSDFSSFSDFFAFSTPRSTFSAVTVFLLLLPPYLLFCFFCFFWLVSYLTEEGVLVPPIFFTFLGFFAAPL